MYFTYTVLLNNKWLHISIGYYNIKTGLNQAFRMQKPISPEQGKHPEKQFAEKLRRHNNNKWKTIKTSVDYRADKTSLQTFISAATKTRNFYGP